MANLLPLNSDYIDTSGTGPSRFPNLSKTIANTPAPSAPAVAAPVQRRVSEWGSGPSASMSDFYNNPAFKSGLAPTNQPIEQAPDGRTTPVPSDYKDFLPGKTDPVTGKVMWATPSDQTYIQNYPLALGGGQYAVDPTQPDAIIKSQRGLPDSQENIIMRGGRSPADIQIDHIVPLNMGGLNLTTNKQDLTTAEHMNKTKAQAVVLTLLQKGLIDDKQARAMTLNWRAYDVSNVPMPDQFGYISNLNDNQLKTFNRDDPKSMNAYYKALGMDHKAEDVNKQWNWDAIHPPGTYGHSLGDSIKSVWKEIPDALDKTLGHSFLGNLGKGLIEGVTAGIIHSAPDEKDKGFANVTARIIGNALGMFIPMGLFAEGLGLAGRALGEIPALAKAFAAPTAIVESLPWLGKVGEGVKAVGSAGEEAMTAKEGGMLSKAGKYVSSKLGSLPGASKVTSGLAKARGLFGGAEAAATSAEDASSALKSASTLGAQDIPMEIKNTRGFLNLGNKVNTGLFFGSYAVATQLMRNGLGVEDQKSFYDYFKNFVTNAVTGGVMEGAGQNWRGYATLAGTALTMGAINGDSPEDMFASAATMVGLHGMGSEKFQRMGVNAISGIRGEGSPIAPAESAQSRIDTLNAQMTTTADKMATDVLSKWAPSTSGGEPIAVDNLHPEVGTARGVFSSQELATAKQEAISNIMKQSHTENWSPEETQSEINKVIGSIRQLDKGNMAKVVRDQADIADIKSVAQGLVNAKSTRSITGGTVPDILRNQYSAPTEHIDTEFKKNAKGEYVKNDVNGDFSLNSGPTDESAFFPIVGTSSSINGGEKSSNLQRARDLIAAGRSDGTVVLVDRGADYHNFNKLKNESVPNGTIQKETNTPFHTFQNPQNTVEAFLKFQLPDNPDGTPGKTDWLPIGFQARQWKIEDLNKNVSKYARKGKPNLSTYPLENNKDTMSDFMRLHKLPTVEGQIVPLLTDPTKGGTRIAKAPENHVRIMITDSHIKNSLKINQDFLNNVNAEAPAQAAAKEAPVTTPVVENPLATKISNAVKQANPGSLTSQEVKAFEKQGFTKDMIDKIEKASIQKASGKVSGTESAPIEPIALPKAQVEATEPAQVEEIKPAKREKKPDPTQFIQLKKGQEGINEHAASLITNKTAQKEFTRPKLTELAKSVSNNGETRDDVIAGVPKFLDAYSKKIGEAMGDPTFKVTDKNDVSKLTKLYTTLAKSGTRQEMVIGNDGKVTLQKGGVQNMGKVDLLTKQFNEKNGLPEDAMQVAHLNSGNEYTNTDDKFTQDSRHKLDGLLAKAPKGFLPVGITGKGIENTVFVKYEPKMVDRFDADPSKYVNEGEKITTPEDKFLRTYMVDVLGMPKDISDGDFVKRANLIYQRYDQYHGPETKANLRILPAQTVGDTPDFRIDTSKFENSDSKEAAAAVKSFHEGKIQDGPVLVGEGIWDKFIQGLGYNPSEHVGSLKALIDTTGPNGEKIYHKGQFTKVDDAIKNSYKESHGIDIGPNDIVSFDSNAKVGPKKGEFPIPLSDVYAKSKTTAGSVSKESPSWERKFLSTDPGVKAVTQAKITEAMKDLSAFNEEIQNSKNSTELKTIFDKNYEKYGLDKDMLFKGSKQASFDLGAAKHNLAFELGKITKNLFADYGINPTYKNSTTVTIIPPTKGALDGAGKPNRYVNNDEIVLGKEQIKDLNVKEGDEVAVHRDPSYDINNVAILKVVDGSKYGHTSLGRENGEVSPYNERIILQGDQDADTMHVTKIGDGGISEAEADAIKQRGSLATPFTEVNPSKSGFVTTKNIQEKIKDQLAGDDQTSWISTQTRIMDEVKDNGITVKVHPAAKGERSKFDILSNGKVVDSGTTSGSKEGFTASPQWGPKERQLMSQAQREAVDSKKSKDIVKRTNNNDPLWSLKQLWKTGTGELTDFQARAAKGALTSIQKPYGIKLLAENANSIDDILRGRITNKATGERDVTTGLSPTVDYYNRLKDAGTELTPQQEKLLAMSKVKSFNIPEETVVGAHKAGADAVSELADKYYNQNNPKLNEIRTIAREAKKENFKKGVSKSERDAAKAKVPDFFLKNLEDGKYTDKDLNEIAYWAARSPEANIAHGINTATGKEYPSAKFIYLYRDLIDASPAISKAYYDASEAYNEPSKKADGQGGPGPSKFTNLTKSIKGKAMGKIEYIARHGSTDSNGEKVFRGWAETKINQLTPKGKMDAMKLGHSIKTIIGHENPDDFVIVSSDLKRATDTAKTASKISGVPLGKSYSDLRSQDTGDYTGKKESEVKDIIVKHIEDHPDVPLPGASESHQDFINRSKQTLAPNGEIVKDYPGKKIIAVVHHQTEVSQLNNFGKNTDAMFSKGIKPGEIRKA